MKSRLPTRRRGQSEYVQSVTDFSEYGPPPCSCWRLPQAPGHGQSAAPQPIMESRLNLPQLVDKLVAKNLERADALQKYQGRRTYTLSYSGFPVSLHAEMVVDMTFDAPATKQFKIVSQSGPQWLVDRVLKRLLETEQEASTEENRARVALNTNNYDFSELTRPGCSGQVFLHGRC